MTDHDEPLECLDKREVIDGQHDLCSGPVEYRMALSATGKSFPRCDKHWNERLDEQDRINDRYPTHAPSDFDPAYAGESWDED